MKKEKKFRMPKNIVLYDLLISCPGDIKSEIKVIEEVVEEFNQRKRQILMRSVIKLLQPFASWSNSL